MKYVLITPAHNEEANIEKTLISMQSQSILPLKWVVVSDGSTDATDEIVEKYVRQNNWIELIRMPIHKDRHFAAKVNAFNAGYRNINNIDYNIIGNLDADISFEKDYMEFLLKQFLENPKIGVAGTPFVEESFKGYNYDYTNIKHVSGACQLFRRKCFEEIGGYIPIKVGGIDWVAVTSARMKGWKTKTFVEKKCYHHRKIGTALSNSLKVNFNYGKKDYYLGWHPLWELFRALYKLKNNPLCTQGLFTLIGYFSCYLKREEKEVERALEIFHREEQMKRLKTIILKTIGLRQR